MVVVVVVDLMVTGAGGEGDKDMASCPGAGGSGGEAFGLEAVAALLQVDGEAWAYLGEAALVWPRCEGNDDGGGGGGGGGGGETDDDNEASGIAPPGFLALV